MRLVRVLPVGRLDRAAVYLELQRRGALGESLPPRTLRTLGVDRGRGSIRCVSKLRLRGRPLKHVLHGRHLGGHLSFMRAVSTGSAALDALVDSYSDYGWMKTANLGKTNALDVPYEDVAAAGVKAWDADAAAAAKLGGKPYIPPISSAWDPSPRTLATDPWVITNGYPWGRTWHSTPAQFQAALAQGRGYLQAHCADKSKLSNGWCPPMLINAWNEWSEGAYLEPDERYGFGKLEAVRAVFGARARDEQPQ